MRTKTNPTRSTENAKSPSWFQKKLRSVETGASITFMGMWYTIMLFILFIFVWDFGEVAYASSKLNSAARVVAQDMAKNIDEDAFLNKQLVRIKDDPATIQKAKEQFAAIMGVPVAELNTADRTLSIQVISQGNRRSFVLVDAVWNGELKAFQGMVSAFDSNANFKVRLNASGYAEPAFGIEQEGQ